MFKIIVKKLPTLDKFAQTFGNFCMLSLLNENADMVWKQSDVKLNSELTNWMKRKQSAVKMFGFWMCSVKEMLFCIMLVAR